MCVTTDEAVVCNDSDVKRSVLCRYVDKDALHEIHERSTPYLRLKDDVKSEGIEYKSVVSQSYYEQDLGFMETKF